MAATWKVVSMTTAPQKLNPLGEPYPNIVFRVNWLASDTDGTYSAQIGGESDIPFHYETYVPYADLTEQQVLTWCFDGGVDKTGIEANLASQIAYQANPPAVELPLPWQV